MKINAPADYDLRHFRFPRQLQDSSWLEVYDASEGRLLWAVAVAIAGISLLALVLA